MYHFFHVASPWNVQGLKTQMPPKILSWTTLLLMIQTSGSRISVKFHSPSLKLWSGWIQSQCFSLIVLKFRGVFTSCFKSTPHLWRFEKNIPHQLPTPKHGLNTSEKADSKEKTDGNFQSAHLGIDFHILELFGLIIFLPATNFYRLKNISITIGCRKTSCNWQIKGNFSHLPHQLFPNSLCISSNSMAGVPTCKEKFDVEKTTSESNQNGVTKTSSHFLLCFGHLSVISQKINTVSSHLFDAFRKNMWDLCYTSEDYHGT